MPRARSPRSDLARAILTVDQVREARRRHVRYCRKNGSRPLAREYGVAKSTMDAALWGISWKGVPFDGEMEDAG